MAYAKLFEQTAESHPDAVAFRSGARERTYGALKARVARVAGGLTSLGLRPGDRVAVLSLLAEEQAELTLALSWAGVTCAPLNVRLAPDELLEIVRDAEVSALAVDDAHAALGARIIDELRIPTLIPLGAAAGPQAGPTLDALAEADPVPRAVLDDDALSLLIYTGGTTGKPKGVMLSHAGIESESAMFAEVMGLDARTAYLHVFPMFHIAGIGLFSGVTRAGGAHVFRPGNGVEHIYEELARSGVDTLCGAPTLVAMMLASPTRDDALLRQVRAFGYGSSSITEPLLRQMIEAMPNARFNQFYGQSEACGVLTTLTPEWHVLDGPKAGRLHTTGRPDPRYELRVVDEQDVEQPRGSPGEIVARGAGFSLGYWRQPAQTAELFRGGWLRTGDIGIMDDDGLVAVVDRRKDMVVSGGENVFCTEVENVLAHHPAVASCAVIGVPHPLWGEAVHAVVTLAPGATATEAELIAHCRGAIAGYKCPKSVAVSAEPLPLSGIGKVMKHVLRERYASLQTT